jgi:hypothetical protein
MATLEPGVPSRCVSRRERAWGIAFQSLSSTFVAVATVATSAWLLGFWSLVVRVRISTGDWPRPRVYRVAFDLPPLSVDPSAFPWHTRALWIVMMLMYYAVPFALLALLASAPVRRIRPDRRLIGAFFASVALAAMTVLLDPGNFFDWFLD